MNLDNIETCPFCGHGIEAKDIFCSKCGKELPKVNTPLSLNQKIKIYAVDVFLAPFGLYWFFKYFRNEEKTKRKVAFNSLYITLVMIVFIVLINYFFLKSVNTYIGRFDFAGLGL